MFCPFISAFNHLIISVNEGWKKNHMHHWNPFRMVLCFSGESAHWQFPWASFLLSTCFCNPCFLEKAREWNAHSVFSQYIWTRVRPPGWIQACLWFSQLSHVHFVSSGATHFQLLKDSQGIYLHGKKAGKKKVFKMYHNTKETGTFQVR